MTLGEIRKSAKPEALYEGYVSNPLVLEGNADMYAASYTFPSEATELNKLFRRRKDLNEIICL